MPALEKIFTAEGSPNIALVKYWGKRDERLVLPCNSSLSMTIHRDAMRTVTSVMLSERLRHDVFYLDGKLQRLGDKELGERMRILDLLREAGGTEARFLIASRNEFPTASGMASSASGIATLVYAANAALGADIAPRDLSIIARQGSGSACRSLFGGLVAWRRGSRADGSDSYAEQVFDERYWPGLIDNIVVVAQERKKVSSRAGMKHTVETSALFKARPDSAEGRIGQMTEAYRARDMDAVAEIMMADSNDMHALMLSTRPSIRYLSCTSYRVMDAIEGLNESEGQTVAGYTFDAGPNANVITTEGSQAAVMDALKPLQDDHSIQYIKTSKAGAGPAMVGGGTSLITDDMVSRHTR